MGPTQGVGLWVGGGVNRGVQMRAEVGGAKEVGSVVIPQAPPPSTAQHKPWPATERRRDLRLSLQKPPLANQETPPAEINLPLFHIWY